jgi:MFS family permease
VPFAAVSFQIRQVRQDPIPTMGRLVARRGPALRPTVVLGVVCASSFSFLLGYDIGIMSGAKRLIRVDFALSEPQLELLVGILNVVSGFGGLLSGRLADSLGRRPSAALACVITIVGACLMAASSSFAMLLVGRVITGVGVGCCFHVAPLYLAEIAPKHVRGKLISFFDLFINVGILIGYVRLSRRLRTAYASHARRNQLRLCHLA